MIRHALTVTLLAVLGLATSASAQVSETEIESTEPIFTEEALAEQWRLSMEDWAVYKTLMEGPRGIWSPNLDPITVLGIHAETESERRWYAELLVMIEFERVEQELRFQQAYDEAARRLFPALAPVATVEPIDAASLIGVDRIRFVGSIDSARCPTCRSELARVLRTQTELATVTLDLFLDDAIDDAAIRSWAVEQGIDPAAVIAGRITLNHTRDSFSLPDGPGPVAPRVLQRLGGRWLALEDSR